MVQVSIKTLRQNIKEVIIKGHANSNSGKDEFDLVCAGISSVVYGVLNSLELK